MESTRDRLVLAGKEDTAGYIELLVQEARSSPREVLDWYLCEENRFGFIGFDKVAKEIAKNNVLVLSEWLRGDLLKGSHSQRDIYFRIGMAVLAHRSPDDTLSLITAGIGSDQLPPSAIEGAVFYLARSRPNETRALILSRLNGEFRNRALKEAAIGAGQMSFEAGLSFASALDDDQLRYGTVAAIASGRIERDEESVVGSLEAMPAEEAAKLLSMGGDAGQKLAAQVAARNPELAYSLLSQITFSSSNQRVFESVLTTTAAHDPDEAVAHIQALPEGASRAAIVSALFSRVSATNLNEALRLASTMDGDVGSLRSAYQAIGAESGSRDLTNALEQAQSAIGVDYRSGFLAAAITSHATDDPFAAAEFLRDSASESETVLGAGVGGVLESVGRSLTNADHEAGWNWVNSLPGPASVHAMSGYASIRVREEPAVFAEQLSQIAPSATWLAGAEVLLNELRQSDIERARQWEAAVQEFKKQQGNDG